MIVLNKKKITIMVLSVFILSFSFIFISENRNENTVPTVSLPVSGKTIVIDARAWKTR